MFLGFYGRIAPKKAARLLADLISRPRGQNPTQPWELATGPTGREIELRTGLRARSWGEQGPLVLALHGWRGRTTQFRPLASKLLEKGMRTVALELPGHGISTDRSCGHARPADDPEAAFSTAPAAVLPDWSAPSM